MLWYYNVLSIYSLLSVINQVLFPQYINCKSGNLQKLLRYLSGIVTSKFKCGTAGCAGRFTSVGFPDCDGLSGVFLTVFVLYLYHLKHYHQHFQFCLYSNSIKFLISYDNFD